LSPKPDDAARRDPMYRRQKIDRGLGSSYVYLSPCLHRALRPPVSSVRM